MAAFPYYYSKNVVLRKRYLKVRYFRFAAVFVIWLAVIGLVMKPAIIDRTISLLLEASLLHQQESSASHYKEVSIQEASRSFDKQVAGVSVPLDHTAYTKPIVKDIRAKVLGEFFRDNGSPLADYGDVFIEACDKYEVTNWQLIPAIAMAETGGGTTDVSARQHNAWGWGGPPGSRIEFSSWEVAIDTITRKMKEMYGNEHLNPRDIQRGYCGSPCEATGWRWAKGVNYYIFRINDYGERYGLERTNQWYEF